jgi:hypothetical protein
MSRTFSSIARPTRADRNRCRGQHRPRTRQCLQGLFEAHGTKVVAHIVRVRTILAKV